MEVEHFVNHFLLPLPEVNNKWLIDPYQENFAHFHDKNVTAQAALLLSRYMKIIKRNNHHAGHHPDTQTRR
jgi:hypothetical protein